MKSMEVLALIALIGIAVQTIDIITIQGLKKSVVKRQKRDALKRGRQ